MSAQVVDLDRLRKSCAQCSLQQLCLPAGISAGDLQQLDEIVRRRRPVASGERLFRLGDQAGVIPDIVCLSKGLTGGSLRDLRDRVALSAPVTKAHGKLATFPAGADLSDWLAEPSTVAGFQTLPGIFSADGPDRGSVLLAAALMGLAVYPLVAHVQP